MHQVDNQHLIQRAKQTYTRASQTYLAQMRALKKSQIRLQEAIEATEAVQVPDRSEVQEKRPADPVQQAQETMTRTKHRLDRLQRRLNLLADEKDLQAALLARLQKARESTDQFLAAVKSLDRYLLEVQLRLEDKTMSKSARPGFLRAANLDKHTQNLRAKGRELDQRIQKARSRLQALSREISTAQERVHTAEDRYAQAQDRFHQEQKRSDLTAEFAALAPETVFNRLQKMEEERVWLKGSLTISYSRFIGSQARVQDLREELAGLPWPVKDPAKELTGMQPADVEQAIEAVDRMIAAYAHRKELLAELKAALKTLTRHAENLQGETQILKDHLFRLQVLAGVGETMLVAGKRAKQDVPEQVRPQEIREARTYIADLQTEAKRALDQATQDLAGLDEKMQTVASLQQEAKSRRASLKNRYQATLRIQTWDQELRKLSTPELVKTFQEVRNQLQDRHAQIRQAEARVRQAEKDLAARQSKLSFLQGPLLRASEQSLLAKKRQIRDKLAAMATSSAERKNPGPAVPTASQDRSSGSREDIEQYMTLTTVSQAQGLQDLLSTRIRVNQKHREYEANLLQAYQGLNQALDQSVAAMQETRKLGQYAYAIGVELKKRIGQNKIGIQEVPPGITEVLNRELIQGLKPEIATKQAYQDHLQDQIGILEQDQNQDGFAHRLVQTRDLLGQRIDVLQEIQELEQSLNSPQEALPGTSEKSLKQQAIRRMKADNTWMDSLLGFISSERIANLTDLLQSYYLELIELEAKQDILGDRKEATEDLIRLAQEEKAVLSGLLPQLQTSRDQLLSEYEREWALIKARLNPQKAEDILSEFQARTGQKLPRPEALPPDRREKAIQALSEHLFQLHLQIRASGKWIDFFQSRLSSRGIKAEVGTYQKDLGALNSQEASLERHIRQLSGIPEGGSGTAVAANASVATAGLSQPIRGEIEKLRTEIENIRQNETFWVLVKLIVVIAAALLLNWGINRGFDALLDRAGNRETPNAQTHFVLSFSRASSKVVIWIVTVILVFTFLGFNVTAVLAGLGIGGLAVAMAARETIANILGGIMIFIERPFNIGDVVHIGSSTAKVQGISWRSTRLTTPFGYTIHIPNSHVTESTITNFTKIFPYGDFISIYVSPKYDPQTVMTLINQALDRSKSILHNQAKGVMVAGTKVFDNVTLMEYWPYWHIEDYLGRNGKRDEVWQRIWEVFSQADIELHFKPLEIQSSAHN